jgi:hypothetical protein
VIFTENLQHGHFLISFQHTLSERRGWFENGSCKHRTGARYPRMRRMLIVIEAKDCRTTEEAVVHVDVAGVVVRVRVPQASGAHSAKFFSSIKSER